MAPHHQHDGCGGSCPECDFGPFTRNAYWTGKLMLARDFVDEQRYVMEKLRHHNQTLHGSGVACGLKVVPHDNPNCRDRFVCVEPGTAIDCCGRDILLREKDCIDLWSIPELKALKDAKDTTAHFLEVCISYRECPTEEVPVLYDECGCDEDRCAPNRILESYELHVHVDPPAADPAPPTDCCSLWKKPLDGCPHCDSADCVVLATVSGYHVGQPIVAADPAPAIPPAQAPTVPPPSPPPADPSAPPASPPTGSAQPVGIDNLTHRRMLPSVGAIKEFLDCLKLCEPATGAGSPGPTVPPAVPTTQDVTLTHISSVNWLPPSQPAPGNDEPNVGRLSEQGLIICFDKDVRALDLHPQSIRVLYRPAPNPNANPNPNLTSVVWTEVGANIVRGRVPNSSVADQFTEDLGAGTVNAVRIRITAPPPGGVTASPLPIGTYRVIVVGDFIRGASDIALDADHLPPWLPHPTGDGIAGGTFESWFTVATAG